MHKLFYWALISLVLTACQSPTPKPTFSLSAPSFPANILDYTAQVDSTHNRNALVFSDQGAWFGYSFQKPQGPLGFSGPFLMTQQNGVWLSKAFAEFEVSINGRPIALTELKQQTKAYASHLHHSYSNKSIQLDAYLYFNSAHTAVILLKATNTGQEALEVSVQAQGTPLPDFAGLNPQLVQNRWQATFEKSPATSVVLPLGEVKATLSAKEKGYTVSWPTQKLEAGNSTDFTLSQSFIFPEYNAATELENNQTLDPWVGLQERINEKEEIWENLKKQQNFPDDSKKGIVIAKSLLTLQNNSRIAAGELKHAGIFPSYHYIWFHGFWAWDSWKHAVAVTRYDPALAKDQIRAMYDYMDPNGFIADCVYRDTTIEAHNYRNTKPPLSAWAVWKVFESDRDSSFVREMYPKIKTQHQWWYTYRDHDQDGLCEYGSTDGTLKAAKWESGMDNAVRFDDSRILTNPTGGYSLDQESVDLNAYLYAEKGYLAQMATISGQPEEKEKWQQERETLLPKFDQFYDAESGWYYDTNVQGNTWVKIKGPEGWIPLWAQATNTDKAAQLKANMMDTTLFNTHVPLPTLNAAHPKFKPDRGYWRGPNWVDQVYFGIKGLHNYGFDKEANQLTEKLIHNAQGLTEKGPSIRENYHPLTGQGMESESFSWSAAHLLLLLTDE